MTQEWKDSQIILNQKKTITTLERKLREAEVMGKKYKELLKKYQLLLVENKQNEDLIFEMTKKAQGLILN